MKGYRNIGFALVMVILTYTCYGQVNPKDACRLEEGRLIFKLDLKWSPEQKQEVAHLFNLDSTVLADAYAGKTKITINGTVWSVRNLTSRIIELSKSLTSKQDSSPFQEDIIMVDDDWENYTIETTRESTPWGINKFTQYKVFQYANGIARFYLPGHQNAQQVFLSGTFNRWSTTQMPMQRSDSGWIIQLRLKPGKYLYKYIVDGRWTSDPFNRQYGREGYIGDNSVVFCYNHWFILRESKNAKNVIVTGSFNNWDERTLKMFKTSYGWALPLYLREGTHAYKFIVDGVWITDPGNKIVRPDGSGHFNSVVGIGESMLFSLKGYPNAKKVMVAGDFNAWNNQELQMMKTTGGWQLPYVLAPGNYEYKFTVDGEWITDPDNPFSVGSGTNRNSILVVQANHTFVLDQSTSAKSVLVSGSFNGWSQDGYRMAIIDHKWKFPIRLKPGKYVYKFVVDGKWIMDPGNELWEENEYGTGNSVIWIEP
ncbi:MAG: hypothetical protein M0Q38_14065 [Bacteroidales bacterium]|jgi:hypothetical protein|nr:hypothetical protein [Bacteroidales bacterium]